MPEIYNYRDSRLFLKDYYEERKKAQPSFSYQCFANKAGFKSKTFIYRVIGGEKTLSKSAALAVAQAMGLSRRETEYFEAMVNFTQAKSGPEREFYLNHLQSFKKSNPASRLRHDQSGYFSKWYLPVLREVAGTIDFKEDYGALARMLDPRITVEQARTGVKLLCDLKLLGRLPSGRYRQTDASVTTGETFGSAAVRTFQKECLRLAVESTERHGRRVRDISTLTVGITEEGYQRIGEEAAEFRRRVVELAKEGEGADRVYQVNIQVFPLTALSKAR